MPRLVADLHLHSRFSRGTSRYLDLQSLASGAVKSGLDLIAAPDYTHPLWLEEMRAGLVEVADGIYRLTEGRSPFFLLSTEVNCVWRETPSGRGRRVHLLVLAPGMSAVDRFCRMLKRFSDLASDGRPTVALSANQLCELAWCADERIEIIPAHCWTPWYGLFGSRTGFDSVGECFGEFAGRIRAIESGLSSDPAMNWRVADVDSRAIVSFSDAHSPQSMGREATVVECNIAFPSVIHAIIGRGIVETAEFHPAHGKYHMDGHRKCGVWMTPEQSRAVKGLCPVCSGKFTRGVASRVEDLATRKEPPLSRVNGLLSGPEGRPPFRRVVPLRQLISQALGVRPASQRVATTYELLVLDRGELQVLTTTPLSEIERVAGDQVARFVGAARNEELDITPGYDGVYGQVTVAARS